MIEAIRNRVVEILTAQDVFYGNTSGLEGAWVIGLAMTIVLCTWGVVDTQRDYVARARRNSDVLREGGQLSGIALAASIRAWGNLRNALIWLFKACIYESIGIFAARTPAITPRAPQSLANAFFPLLFLFLGGLLVFQVLSEWRDRQRVWEALSQKGERGEKREWQRKP